MGDPVPVQEWRNLCPEGRGKEFAGLFATADLREGKILLPRVTSRAIGKKSWIDLIHSERYSCRIYARS